MTYVSLYLVFQAIFFAAFAWFSDDLSDNASYKIVKKFSPGADDKFVIESKDLPEFIEYYKKSLKYTLFHVIAKALSKGSLILALIIYLWSVLSSTVLDSLSWY